MFTTAVSQRIRHTHCMSAETNHHKTYTDRLKAGSLSFLMTACKHCSQGICSTRCWPRLSRYPKRMPLAIELTLKVDLNRVNLTLVRSKVPRRNRSVRGRNEEDLAGMRISPSSLWINLP